jgi:hypothetical protein
MTASPATHQNKPTAGGKLKIGDDWNAIRIIALSQSNPLKAIAEFVENSIDAHARAVVITRGRESGAHYLSIKDDGDGIPRDDEGLPNFKYVATHICDSIKRHLKTEGKGSGLQGEFGIGLLSFWTVGNTLTMTSAGADQRAYQMTMSKGDSRYKVTQRRVLFAEGGTELKISPLLEGIRNLSGEKIQWFLASELRDRLRTARVRVRVIDKLTRKQYEVEPRAYEGRLLHQLPAIRTPYGDAYAELYLAQPSELCQVALTRSGTRVVENLANLPGLDGAPWSSRYLQGLIDAPFLSLTPGTRSGVIHDERYGAFLDALKPLETSLKALIEAQQRAEDEQASQQSLRAIQRAFREALLALPPEIPAQARGHHRTRSRTSASPSPPPARRANVNSSTTRARSMASSSRRRPVLCRSTSGDASGYCRAIARAGASRTSWHSPGRSSKARDRSTTRSIRKSSSRRQPCQASCGCASP